MSAVPLLHSGMARKVSGKGKYFKLRRSIPCCTFCLERDGQRYGYALIHGLWLMVWLDSQELGWSMIRKLVRRKSGEEVCEQTSPNGHGIFTFVKVKGENKR